MKQVILAQLLQAVGELLHVDVLVPAVLLLGRVLASYTICVSSTRLLEEGEQLWLGVSESLISRH
jgi:hypothetical protein